ncbi:Protein PEROXIN-4, partial [Dichanthelium oligosanthes]
ASRARLFKELKEVQREKSADPDIQLICDDSNIFKWTALIKGPSETPYEGGVFQLAFAIPEQYPLLPPQVRFLTKIFHPNVHFKTGEICLDILKNAWSPAWTLQSVCRAIIALMAHPEPDSPLNCDSGSSFFLLMTSYVLCSCCHSTSNYATLKATIFYHFTIFLN